MPSNACCELPPVSAEYEHQGRWVTVANIRTYIVGNEDSNKAIIDIYDVFGASAQALQGADRLATLTSVLVFVPDFFNGRSLERTLMPAEKKEKMEAFLNGPANLSDNGKKLVEIRAEVGTRWPNVEEHIGVFGLCWGGKVSIVACGEGNDGKGRKFTVSGTAHPRSSKLDAKDAEKTNVPHILLASPGEPEDVVAQYNEILSQPGKIGEVETYSTMFHGWMGARAKLDDEKNVQEYERGYKQVADFFSKYL
ncbi:dienelactone hydrolase family protein [Fusarium austroafricanum]|uniref:Dienelactone hydrolase family protein n=1 Tax=Fusarium austroafricanum TaxID=2364996 RepID=A0A8H4KDZ5_9HYPO|nr:dienelactone hydrolase family protein [Fusarium austroafricanum]